MRHQILALGLLTGLSAASAFAEPPVQAGETLESLSKAKVTTTVNGQPGSLNELLASGQIKLVNDAAAAQTGSPAQAQAQAQAGVPTIEPEGNAATSEAAAPSEAPEANAEAPQAAEPAANQ